MSSAESRERAASGPASVANLPRGLRWGPAGILAVWLALMAVLYFVYEAYLQPKPATVTADGELVIPRHRDGHFYVQGRVNGKPILFMVDTGASSVIVSEAFARDARLPPGEPTVFHTANGSVHGSRVRGVEVSAGPFTVSSNTVGVGLVGGPADHGLLGQGFLSKFEMSVSKKQLVLRRPG
jgi:aspartyl protease family protein